MVYVIVFVMYFMRLVCFRWMGKLDSSFWEKKVNKNGSFLNQYKCIASLSSSQHNVKNFRWTRMFLHEPMCALPWITASFPLSFSPHADPKTSAENRLHSRWSSRCIPSRQVQVSVLTTHSTRAFSWLFLLKVSTAGKHSRAFQPKRSNRRYSFSIGVSAYDVPFAHRTPIQNDAVRQ